MTNKTALTHSCDSRPASFTKSLFAKHLLALSCLLGVMMAGTASAQVNNVWTGDPGATNLNDANAWGGVLPVSGNSTWEFGSANAGSGNSLTNDFTAGFNVSGITFDSGALSYTISGNSLQLSGGITNNSSVLQTISNALVPQTGGLNLTTTAGGGNLTLAGIISGANALNYNGAGTVTLKGANTYTGTHTVSSGVLSVGAVNNIGAAGATVTLNGGAIQFTSGVGTAYTQAFTVGASGGTMSITGGRVNLTTANRLLGSGSLTVSGNGTLDSSANQTGVLVLGAISIGNTYSGAITLQNGGLIELNNNSAVAAGATFTLGNNAGLNIDSNITTANALTVNGTNSVLSFANGNTGIYSGPITLNQSLIVGLRDWYNYATPRSGKISGNISGSGTLVLSAPAGQPSANDILTLSGSNSYTGGTAINSGVVDLTSINALPGLITNGAYSVANNAGLLFNNAFSESTVGSAVYGTTNFAAGAYFGLDSTAGSITLTNKYTNTAQGSLGLVVNGANIVTLTGSNSYTGGTVILAGTLQVGNGGASSITGAITDNGTLVINSSGGNTLTNVISGTGNFSAIGSGTTTLTAANTYTGSSTVQYGTLKLDFSAAGAPANNIIATNGGLVLNSGNLSINGSASQANAQTFGGGTTTNQLTGANTLNLTAQSGQTLTVNLRTFNQTVVGTTFAILTNGPGTITVTGTAGVNVNAPANTPINSATGGFLTGAFVTYGLYDYAMLSSTNVVALGSVPANYTTNGTGGGNIDVTTSYSTPASTISVNAIRFNTAGASTLTITATYTSGGTLVTPNVGTNNVSITASGNQPYEPNRSTTSGSESVIWQNNTLGYFSINGNVYLANGKTGAANWVQAGPGTVQYNQTTNFGSVNAFTGSMYLNGGYTLVSAIGNPVFGAEATAAALNLNGGTVVAGTNFTMDSSGVNKRPVALGTVGGGLSAATGVTLTVDGVISNAVAGAGPLTIATGTIAGTGVGTANTNAVIGNGTVVLSGVNTYTGGTIINPGTLSVSANANLGATTSPVLLNGGTLQNTAPFTDTHVITVGASGGTLSNSVPGANNNLVFGTANTLVGSGSLSITGGTVSATQSNSFSGALSISNGGIFEFGASNAIAPTALVTVDTNGEFALDTNSSNSITLQNGGILSPNSGSQTLTGALTLGTNGGMIELREWWSNSIGLNLKVAQGITGSGGLTVSAPNGTTTLTLNGTNSYTGGTTVNSGVLTVAAGGTLTNSIVTIASNGVLNVQGTAGSVNAGGTAGILAGNGNVGAVTLNSGGVLDPGNGGAGATLTLSSLIINGGSSYSWNLNGAANDFVNVTGAATFNSTTNSMFTISVTSNGITSWNPAANTNFTILTVGSFSGYDPTTINLSVVPGLSTNGSWSFATNGNSLQLFYSVALPPVNISAGTGTVVLESLDSNNITPFTSNPPLIMSGAGEYVLDLSNSAYTGSTTIGSGTLTAANNASFGTASGILLGTATNGSSNAAVNIKTAGVTLSRQIIVNGSGSNTIGNSSGGTVTYSGAITANSNVTVANINTNGGTAFGTLAVNGHISGSGAVTFSAGAGTISLNASNSYSGASTANSGTLQIGATGSLGTNALTVNTTGILDLNSNNATVASLTSGGSGALITNSQSGASSLTVNGSTTTTYAGSIGGNISLQKSGTGMLQLSGPVNYVGNTTVNAGTLVLNGSGINYTGTTTVSGATTLSLTNGATLGNSTNALNVSAAGVVDFGSGTASSGAVAATNSTLQNGTLSGSGYTVSGATVSATLTDGISPSALTNAGGTTTLSGSNSYTGGTVITGGTLVLSGGDNLLSTNGTVSLANLTTLNLGGNNQTLTGLTGTSLATVTNSAKTLTLNVSGSDTYGGTISGAGSLTITGAGTTTLTGGNTYTGITTVASGSTLVVGGTGSLGATAITNDGSLFLSSTAANYNLSGGIKGVGSVAITSGSVGLYANTFSGGLTLGTATVFLNNGNSLGAGTVTAAGTTQINVNGQSITQNIAVPSGNTFTFENQSGTLPTFNPSSVTGSGNITIQTHAANIHYNVAGDWSAFTGSLTLYEIGGGSYETITGNLFAPGANFTNNNSAGVVIGTGVTNLTFGTLNDSLGYAITLQTANAPLTFNLGSNNLAGNYKGTLSGNNTSVVKSGTGTQTFTGNNTYSGGTTVNAGTLAITNGGTLGATNDGVTIGSGTIDLGAQTSTNGAFTISSGTLQNGTLLAPSYALTGSGSITATLADGATGASALTKSGAGTATLTGSNTYTGGTIVNAGTLAITNGGTMGASNNAITLNAGTIDLGSQTSTKGNFTMASGILQNGTLSATNYALTGSGSITANLADGFAGPSALTKSGVGTATLTGSNTITGGTTVNAGTLAITNGGTLGATNDAITLNAGTIDLGGQTSTKGNFTMASGTIQNGTLAATNYSLTSGTVSATLADGATGASPVSLSGTGTVTFTTNQTYTGTTALHGATAALGTGVTLASTNINLGTNGAQGTLSIADSAYTLASNQTLKGFGTVNIGAGAGTLTANGHITTGDSAIISVNGSLTLGSTAVTTLTITAPGIAGTDYDAVQVTNALTYNGTLNIAYSGVTSPVGTFNLFTAGSFVTSDFTGVNLTGTWSPGTFVSQGSEVWSYTAGDGSSIIFNGENGNLIVSAVPEPSTWALLGLSLIVGLVLRRKLLRQKERSA